MSLTSSAMLEEPASDTISVEAASLPRGFVQLPKAVLYAQNLTRDAKLLYAVLLGYAWQEQRCFPGYQRLCADLDASENMVRKYMRELEAVHLVSQHRRGQGRTNIYILHDLRTAQLEVQDQHKMAVLKPQEAEDNEEAVQKQTENKESRVRNSKGTRTSKEEPGNEHRFTHSSVFSTAKDGVLRSLAGQQTQAFSPIQHDPSPPGSKEQQGKPAEGRKKEPVQAHQLAGRRVESPVWLPGYIVDFSREFHDEAAIPSNIPRATRLFDGQGWTLRRSSGRSMKRAASRKGEPTSRSDQRSARILPGRMDSPRLSVFAHLTRNLPWRSIFCCVGLTPSPTRLIAFLHLAASFFFLFKESIHAQASALDSPAIDLLLYSHLYAGTPPTSHAPGNRRVSGLSRLPSPFGMA